jgi:hypothetical protein
MTDGPQPADRPDGTTDTDGAATSAAHDTAADDTAADDVVVDAEVVAPLVPVPPPAAPTPNPDYDERGVPSLDYVRDKIEGRYATSLGTAELAGETAAGRSVEQQEAERADKAKAKLDEIRRSLGL